MISVRDAIEIVKQLAAAFENRKHASDFLQVQAVIAQLYEQTLSLKTELFKKERENLALNDVIAKLQQQVLELQSPRVETEPVLTEEPEKILGYLVHARGVQTAQLAHAISMDQVRVEYWLGVLVKNNMVTRALSMGAPTTYALGQKGREYIIRKGMA